jgi:hypothetical protein
MLNGYSGLVAKKKAPAEAENTEAFSANLIPLPTVIPTAKASNNQPLS